MLPSGVQVETAEVRVTSGGWRRGRAIGHHFHKMNYVMVPATSGELIIVAPNGGTAEGLRKAGGEHEMLNESPGEIVFLEVELKP
jgi:beta-alanine degradation protein BauB